MVAMGKKAWFALMNWKTRMGSPRSPVRTRLLPLPGYRAPGAVAGSHAADGSAPRARRWSGRPVRGPHRDQPDEPSSRSPGRSVRTRATAPPVFAQIGPEQPSVAGIPAHRVGDSSALMAPPSQLERCPPNRVNSNSRPTTSVLAHHPKPIARSITTQRCGCAGGYGPNTRSGDAEAGRIHSRTSTGTSGSYVCPTGGAARRGRRREVLSESAVREIYLLRSMSGVWKRSHGRPTKAPPDERGGNRHGRPNTTAPHPDSTVTSSCRTYHHISLPSRIAVGDTITISFGSHPKEFGFSVARIDLKGQHCSIFSKAEGDRHLDKINVAPVTGQTR